MVNQDAVPDAAKSLECKELGNKCYQNSDYKGAEEWYTKAINYDPSNALLYTNRAMALLKLHIYPDVVVDSLHAISLLPYRETMKAHFQLAQAYVELKHPDALANAKIAHELCVEEIHIGGKGASSITPITELVLRCKKEDWERRETERLKARDVLLAQLYDLLNEDRRKKKVELASSSKDSGAFGQLSEDINDEYDAKLAQLAGTFATAKINESEAKKRIVPDWIIDDITFSVMVDPVVTKTGQSYDRSSIMEHLKRSATDPLTREPLRAEDLRPNLALREACEEFLNENGWAVDY